MTHLHWAVLENIVTVLAIAAIIVGVYALGGGGHGFWALLLMANINSYGAKSK